MAAHGWKVAGNQLEGGFDKWASRWLVGEVNQLYDSSILGCQQLTSHLFKAAKMAAIFPINRLICKAFKIYIG
jgi:hypothetical protein